MEPDWKALPSLSALRAFDAAARHLSFSAGARALNVTAAAIIQHVRALERELGCELVRREGRGIALTGQGELLAKSLDRGFGEIASGIHDLRGRDLMRGVRVNSRPNIISEFLITRMAEFWEIHPEIEVSLVPSPWNESIFRGGFDLAICGGDGHFPGLEAQQLVRSRWVVAVTPENLTEDPVDLSRLKWVINPELAPQLDLMHRIGLDPDDVEHAKIVSAAHVLHAVREGLGATLSNAFVIRKDLAAGRLRAIELEDMPDVGYWAVTPTGTHREAVDAFVSWLKSAFTDEARKYPEYASACS